MALYDLDGTATGSAVVSGSLGVLTSASGTISGSGGPLNAPSPVEHNIIETLIGAASLLASTQAVFNFSGFVQGSGEVRDLQAIDLAELLTGSGVLTGDLLKTVAISGAVLGRSSLVLSVPEPIYGVAIVTAFMDVIHVPLPICQTPHVTTTFPWGHQLTTGDLEICVANRAGPVGPVCITYTLYQVVRGCALIQKGPANRKPGNSRVGCYYATGTAGECGQPGLWAIKWSYQLTFGNPVVEKTCYFTVLDSVLKPVQGDTLQRICKYGWD